MQSTTHTVTVRWNGTDRTLLVDLHSNAPQLLPPRRAAPLLSSMPKPTPYTLTLTLPVVPTLLLLLLF